LVKKIRLKFIGIRPGEKIHEIMCSSHDAHQTFEFKTYYIISPDIYFQSKQKNNLVKKDKGKPVNSNFEYSSGTNKHFLSIDEIKTINKILK